MRRLLIGLADDADEEPVDDDATVSLLWSGDEVAVDVELALNPLSARRPMEFDGPTTGATSGGLRAATTV